MTCDRFIAAIADQNRTESFCGKGCFTFMGYMLVTSVAVTQGSDVQIRYKACEPGTGKRDHGVPIPVTFLT